MTGKIPQDAKRVRLAYDDPEGRTVVTDVEVERRVLFDHRRTYPTGGREVQP